MSVRSETILQIKKDDAPARHTSLRVQIANTFISRLIGLLSRKSLADGEALLLVPCASIHTFGMRFSIDVLFLDAKNRVLGYADDVMPNRVRLAPSGTVKVVEIAQGNRMRTGINLDDYLIFD